MSLLKKCLTEKSALRNLHKDYLQHQ